MGPDVEAQVQKAMDAEQNQNHQLQQQQCYMEKGVILEPFVHQVGGHCCVLRFGEQTICKPLFPREHQFYKCLPAVMREFTPQYRGVVSVSFEEDQEGNTCLIAYPIQDDPEADLENKDLLADCENYSKDRQSCHSHKDNDKSVHKLLEDVELEWQQQKERSHSNSVPQFKHTPWSITCQPHQLKKMKKNSKHCNQHKFILLENLTWQHTVPCVLDLKLGTQYYDDDATEEKKAYKNLRCELSTALSIRAYLGGMQVYQSDTGQQMFMSKRQGLRMSLPDLKEALFQFFHSGRRLRRELISLVVRRLREMQAALEACESYRFYSSSLLIIYDGASLPQHTRQHTEDGLSKEDEDEEAEEEEEVSEVAGPLGFPHSPSTSSNGSSSSGGSSVSQACLSRSDPRSPLVDVRMIDFAHITCKNFQGDKVVYEGLDSDYLFGLQNMITMISELENHSTD